MSSRWAMMVVAGMLMQAREAGTSCGGDGDELVIPGREGSSWPSVVALNFPKTSPRLLLNSVHTALIRSTRKMARVINIPIKATDGTRSADIYAFEKIKFRSEDEWKCVNARGIHIKKEEKYLDQLYIAILRLCWRGEGEARLAKVNKKFNRENCLSRSKHIYCRE